MNNTMVWFTWAMQMQKQTHAQENTVLLKNTNRNDDRFYVLCIGTWACIAFASNTLQLEWCKCMKESKLKYVFLPSWDAGYPNLSPLPPHYACLCTRLCMNSLLALLFVWLMLPSLVHTESIYDAAIWKIASTLAFDGFMSSYQELEINMICPYTQHSSGLRQCKTLYLIVIFPFSHFNLHAVFALSFSIHITES